MYDSKSWFHHSLFRSRPYPGALGQSRNVESSDPSSWPKPATQNRLWSIVEKSKNYLDNCYRSAAGFATIFASSVGLGGSVSTVKSSARGAAQDQELPRGDVAGRKRTAEAFDWINYRSKLRRVDSLPKNQPWDTFYIEPSARCPRYMKSPKPGRSGYKLMLVPGQKTVEQISTPQTFFSCLKAGAIKPCHPRVSELSMTGKEGIYIQFEDHRGVYRNIETLPFSRTLQRPLDSVTQQCGPLSRNLRHTPVNVFLCGRGGAVWLTPELADSTDPALFTAAEPYDPGRTAELTHSVIIAVVEDLQSSYMFKRCLRLYREKCPAGCYSEFPLEMKIQGPTGFCGATRIHKDANDSGPRLFQAFSATQTPTVIYPTIGSPIDTVHDCADKCVKSGFKPVRCFTAELDQNNYGYQIPVGQWHIFSGNSDIVHRSPYEASPTRLLFNVELRLSCDSEKIFRDHRRLKDYVKTCQQGFDESN